MTLVDTGAWYASLVPADVNHAAAVAWMAANPDEPLLTTDYVIDEVLTLLRARGHGRAAVEWGERVFAGELAEVHYLTPADIAAAWAAFVRFADKGWSFTDCTSRAVMEARGVARAFAFDQHFRQFGTVAVVP